MLTLAFAAGLGEILVIAIVVAAVIAVALTVAGGMGVPVPAWVWRVAWIVFGAFVAVVAIRFLIGLL